MNKKEAQHQKNMLNPAYKEGYETIDEYYGDTPCPYTLDQELSMERMSIALKEPITEAELERLKELNEILGATDYEMNRKGYYKQNGEKGVRPIKWS